MLDWWQVYGVSSSLQTLGGLIGMLLKFLVLQFYNWTYEQIKYMGEKFTECLARDLGTYGLLLTCRPDFNITFHNWCKMLQKNCLQLGSFHIWLVSLFHSRLCCIMTSYERSYICYDNCILTFASGNVLFWMRLKTYTMELINLI